MRICAAVCAAGLADAWMAQPLAGAATPGEPHRTVAPRVESRADPLGIGEERPALSWRLEGERRGVSQRAYQVQVATSAAGFDTADLAWDSGRVDSDQSTYVEYAGPPVASGLRYHWRVRTWADDGRASAWSPVGWWEMGLLRASDWTASWITPAWDEDTSQSNPAPMLRKSFHLAGAVREARLYVTGLGLYEVELNGRRVGDAVLTPGWTNYDRRIVYQTHDVTALLHAGNNGLGVTLGDGWYRGPLKWELERNTYGDRLAVLAQLRIAYADGRVEVVETDSSWKAATGPILQAGIYAGECYDARLERPGWSTGEYDDRDWKPVRELELGRERLVASPSAPMRRIEEVKPLAVVRTPAGDTVVDFGQNMVGWVRMTVRGPSGATVRLRHAEVLDPHGNFYTENLRHASQRIDYTLRGGSEETYEPRFTFQGFRYVAVEGYPGDLTLDRLTGIVVHSDLARTGEWSSSSERLNQLQHNIVWGQKGNFLGVPTDCPQRDERLGWTGDAQVFARTAAFNMDVSGFFASWLRDLASEQKPDGAVPIVIPDVLSRGKPTDSSSGWGDAATIVPWTLYQVYGDKRLLATQYPSMKAWVEFIRGRARDGLWTTGWHFGDWLSFATTSPDYPGATTGKDLIATAYYAHSCDLVAKAGAVLGHDEDVRTYEALRDRIKAAFNHEFVTPAGRVGEATQTAYVLALAFELLPESMRPDAARRLAEDVRDHGNHLTTGFLGTPHLCRVLSDHGQLETAYALLQQESYPSWLYPLNHGATTIWERWDGIKPDGSFQDPGMNSFNHYAYGAIGDWLYRVVAGLDLDAEDPGYRHVIVRPRPGGGLTQASASLDTRYGPVAVAWRLQGRRFEMSVAVPPNARATVLLPGAVRADDVSESGNALSRAMGIEGVETQQDEVVLRIGSGSYVFAYPVGDDRLAPSP